MSDQTKDQTPGNADLENAASGFWETMNTGDNAKHAAARAKNAVVNAAANKLQSLTSLVNGQAAQPAPPPAAPPASTQAAGNAAPPAGTPAPTAPPPAASTTQPPAQTTPPAQGAAPAAAPAAAGQQPPAAKEEDMSWIAKLALKIPGVKSWAAGASVPLITQGQSLMEQLQAKGKHITVSDDMGAYFGFLSGDYTTIPKAVHDYGKVILNAMGIEDDNMVNALCVGFLDFLHGIGEQFGLLDPVKGFNRAADPKESFMNLFKFGNNPNTLVRLFGLAPPDATVDPNLLGAVKGTFEGDGVENVDKYFPQTEGIDFKYSDFVSGYAQMGQDMVASGKWTVDQSKITPELQDAAVETLEKAGVTDADGTLTQGLIVASLHGADIIQKMMHPEDNQPAAPAPAPDPAKPAAAAKPGGQ